MVAATLLAGCGSDDSSSDEAATPQSNLPVAELPILRVEDFPAGFEEDADAEPDAEEDESTITPAACQDAGEPLDDIEKKADVDMSNLADGINMSFTVAQTDFDLAAFEQTLADCTSMTLSDNGTTGTITLSPHELSIPDADSAARLVVMDIDINGNKAFATGFVVVATIDGFVMSGQFAQIGEGTAPADKAAGENIPYTEEFFDLVDKQIDYIKNAG